MARVSSHRGSTAIHSILALSAALVALGLSQSASVRAAEAPNPFFPSSSSTSKHTTSTKTVSPASKATGIPPHTSTVAKLPVPASARVKATTIPIVKASATISPSSSSVGASTPASSPTPSTSSALGAARIPTRHPAKAKKGRPFSLSSLSTEAIVVAALAGLLIVLCLLWSIAHWLVYEPRWMLSSRHSLEEASFRVSASLSEFADWVRLGR
jgi:hypothetical protein